MQYLTRHDTMFARARALGFTQRRIGRELNRSIKSVNLAFAGKRPTLLGRIDRLLSRYERRAAERAAQSAA